MNTKRPTYIAEVGPYDWEYFHMPALVTPEMVPYGNNTFELVMLVRVVPLFNSHL